MALEGPSKEWTSLWQCWYVHLHLSDLDDLLTCLDYFTGLGLFFDT